MTLKNCPHCGGTEQRDDVVGEFPTGDPIHAVVCAACGEVLREQSWPDECLHTAIYQDEAGLCWCMNCDAWLGNFRAGR